MGRAPGGVVLVVDDVQLNLQLLGGVLTEQHYEVLFATNGPAALERIAARPPDLLLLDMMMPGMDGLEVCRRLKADPSTMDIPVIFLTAAQSTDLPARALRAGAVDYVSKPFNVAELLARVRTHVTLKRTRDELRRIIAQKNELMSVVAHDLKNPISAVRFSALMLRDEGVKPPDPRSALVDAIVESCENMLSFIQQRLEESARASRLEQLTIAQLDLLDAVSNVVQQNLPSAHAKQITLSLDFDERRAMAVMADFHALVQVLNNLLSNAIKFSPLGRPVRIVVEPVPGEPRLRIAVRDQGPGLTESDREHLFEPYRRLSARPTANESSTGLGLSIARDLIEKMGGSIGCDSTPGEGATFWITLPVAGNSAKAARD